MNAFTLIIAGISLGSLYALVALGLVLIYRTQGIVNFAHGEILMVGAFIGYTAFELIKLPYPLAFVAAILLGGFLGALIERLVFRRVAAQSHATLAMVAVGLSVLLKGGARLPFGSDVYTFPPAFGGAGPIQIGPALVAPQNLLITGVAIVRERERGTLEQLIVTPLDKTSLMLGKILPFVLVGYVQMTVILILGKLLFDIPIRGSLVLLYVITFGFIVANLGIGLLISTLVGTQVQAMQLGFFTMLPNILLSGFMFPRVAMPKPAQWLGAALPLTYYLEVLRGILLKDVGLEYLWRDAVILFGFAVVLVTLSVRRFSKTVD